MKTLKVVSIAVTLAMLCVTPLQASQNNAPPPIVIDTTLTPLPTPQPGPPTFPGTETEQPPAAPPPPLHPSEMPWVWHPVSVVNEVMYGFNAIRRTYALPPDINPAVISQADFEMAGQLFRFAYILQQPVTNESFMEARVTVSVETTNNDITEILSRLDSEMAYSRDGFTGTLVLNLHSISTSPSGSRSTTTTATRQRTFPHLSSPDNALIPRTITDGGRTFTLTNVDWVSAAGVPVDNQQQATSFTAHATYSAQVTTTRTTGYVTTAEYIGTVFRTMEGTTFFTAVFLGEPIVEVWLEPDPIPPAYEPNNDFEEPPELPPALPPGLPPEIPPELPSELPPEASQQPSNNVLPFVIGGLLLAGIVGAGAWFGAKKFYGHTVEVYSNNGPNNIAKAGTLKIDVKVPQPEIDLTDLAIKYPSTLNKYLIRIPLRTVEKLVNRTIDIKLGEQIFEVTIPQNALMQSTFELPVDFTPVDDGEDYDG